MTAVQYLLDTNICIFIRQNRRQEVVERFRTLSPGQVAISVVSYGELAYGAEKSRDRGAALKVLNELVRFLPVLPLPRDAGEAYGSIRAALERQGNIIGNNDLWIAAHALTGGLTLVTNNMKEFARVPSLAVENWASDS